MIGLDLQKLYVFLAKETVWTEMVCLPSHKQTMLNNIKIVNENDAFNDKPIGDIKEKKNMDVEDDLFSLIIYWLVGCYFDLPFVFRSLIYSLHE